MYLGGGIEATDLQAAVSELDSEKVANGFTAPVVYASGIALNSVTKTVTYNNQIYCPTAAALAAAGGTITTTNWVTDSSKFQKIDGVSAQLVASSGSSLVGYTPAGTGAVARDVQSKLRESVSVKDFGAVGDDTTNCVASFQAAINYLISVGGGELRVPRGTYWFPEGVKLDVGVGGIDFVGEGDGTVLHYHEGTTIPSYSGVGHLFKNTSAITKYPVSFKNFTIKGTLDGDTRAGRWACPIYLDNYPAIEISNMQFLDIAGEGMDLHKCGYFICDNNVFKNIAADAIRARDTPNCIITDNYILRNGDDAIAIHTSVGYSPTREGVVITGNRIINGGAIKVLGGRLVHVTGNQIEMGNMWGITVNSSTGSEGTINTRDIVISDNIILDMLSIYSATPTNTQVGIQVSSIAPRGTAMTNGTIPGNYNVTAGAFTYPWNYDDLEVSVAANPVSHQYGVIVSGNVIRRSRPNVAAYSDYGFGTRLWQGIAYDPAIDDSDLNGNSGITLAGGFIGLSVSNNTIESFRRGIEFTAPSSNLQYANCKVNTNRIFNCSSYALVVGSASFTQDITFSDNTIDGDPYRLNVNSNTDGTYDADNATPHAINVGDVSGIKFTENKIKNVNIVFQANSLAAQNIRGNILSCQPVNTATGFSTLNKGIGSIPRASARYIYEIIDADPTNATYGAVTVVQQAEASAMPSSGFYVQGAFVRNSSPSIQGAALSRYVIDGWTRITTGTSHVAGTDWVESRSLTGT